MGAFARDRASRKQWWDDHLWLQMLSITVFCIVGGIIAGMNVIGIVVFTVLFVGLVYGMARWMLNRTP